MSEIIASKVKNEPNVVPLCDVLLVLLIIFMVITPTLQRGMDIVLPETARGPVEEAIVLSLDKELHLDLNGKSVEFSLLEKILHDIFATRQSKVLFIKAERDCGYKDVVRVLDVCKNAGISTLCMVNG